VSGPTRKRALIRERVMAGLARAKKHGTKSGRSLGRPRLAPAVEEAIKQSLRAGGKGIHKIAAEHGVGSGTVQRVRAEMAGEADGST
jgi:DNA invertase Pin-like site-specific DNA recombinase